MVTIRHHDLITPQIQTARPNVSAVARRSSSIDRFSGQTCKVTYRFPTKAKAISDPFPVKDCQISILSPKDLNTSLIRQICGMIKRAQDDVGEIQSADSASYLEEEFDRGLRYSFPGNERLVGIVVKNQRGQVIAYTELRRPLNEDINPDDYPFILNLLYVDPQYQQKGIGTWMVKNILQQAKNWGNLNQIILHASNPHAIRLYQQFGFKFVSSYVPNPRVETLRHLGIDIEKLGQFEWAKPILAKLGLEWREHYTVYSDDKTQSQNVYQLARPLK